LGQKGRDQHFNVVSAWGEELVSESRPGRKKKSFSKGKGVQPRNQEKPSHRQETGVCSHVREVEIHPLDKLGESTVGGRERWGPSREGSNRLKDASVNAEEM